MTDHNQQCPPNNQTSAPAPTRADFVAPERKSYDRNRSGGQREVSNALPDIYDERGLFRTPIRFPRAVNDGGGNRGGISREADLARSPSSGGRRGSDSAQGRLVPNSEATPEYRPKTLLMVGFYAFLGELIIGAFFYGCYLLVMEVTR